MQIVETALPGVLVLAPTVFADDRGTFVELWNEARFDARGLRLTFRQDNVSSSHPNVVRGLHAQSPSAQAKLITCVTGETWNVAVDARVGSPTFGRWHAEVLSAENRRQIFVPTGFLHGFAVLRGDAAVHYKCTEVYRPEEEVTVAWDDPDLAIRWPLTSPILSAKDARGLRLRDVPLARRFTYAPSAAPLASRGALR